jgi:OOP family OmpA-OmpF porin
MFHSVFGGFSYYFKFSRDSDGDGVKDEKDVCKDTPAGIAVDEFGCPYDSDYDGIPDYKDLCQGTPRNVQVDSVGCPLDSDSDGIADYLDECPGTLPGVEVDSVGCRKEEIVGLAIEEIEENVPENERILVLGGTANFPLGGSDLLPNPKSGLSRLSEYMKKNPDLEWIIEGHTDNVGNEVKNFQLSLDRAKAVLNYFIDQGMDQEKFTVLAAGSTKPLADNSVEFGRALNRRVVIEEKGSYDRKMEMMTPVNSDNYSLENEFNIESLIFTDGNYFCIQVSSWQSKNKAEKVFKDLIMKGHPAFISETKDKTGDKWYRIRIGYFNNLEGARTYLKTIR